MIRGGRKQGSPPLPVLIFREDVATVGQDGSKDILILELPSPPDTSAEDCLQNSINVHSGPFCAFTVSCVCVIGVVMLIICLPHQQAIDVTGLPTFGMENPIHRSIHPSIHPSIHLACPVIPTEKHTSCKQMI